MKMEEFNNQEGGENTTFKSVPSINKNTTISLKNQQPPHVAPYKSSWDCGAEFIEAMRRDGIHLTGEIIPDGKIHRFKPEGKHNPDAWYVSFGRAGAYGDWSKGVNETWSARNYSLNSQQREQLNKEIEETKKAYQEEVARAHQEASEIALKDWDSFSETGYSDYLEKKQVEAFGVRFGQGCIVIPIHDVNGKLWSYQKIFDNGDKRLLNRGRKKGCFHVIGELKDDQPFYVVEGYATGASIYMATNVPVVVAIDAGNIEPVVAALKEKYPNSEITIAADNDWFKTPNVGKIAAETAARQHNCRVVLAVFKVEKYRDTPDNEKPTDFNDLHVSDGLEEVQKQLYNKTEKTVAVVALSQKNLINQCDKSATASATDIVTNKKSIKNQQVTSATTYDKVLQLLQFKNESHLNENEVESKTNIFLVRDIKDEIKTKLALWYPDHIVTELNDFPSFSKNAKEVIILSSCETGEEQKRRDRHASRLLQQQNIATSISYISQDNALSEEQLKSLILHSKEQLEISSSLPKMTNAQKLFTYRTKEAGFLIHGLIPATGLSILAAHPKTGKSWMALNFIRCISQERDVFNEFPSRQVGVYYLSLEDNAFRLTNRLKKVYEQDTPDVSNITLRASIGSSKFLEELRAELESRPEIKFIIIDPFQKVRGIPDKKSNANAYQADYRDMTALKDLAEELEVSILLIHHLKKDKDLSEADIGSLNGSMGLAGASDSIMLLTKEDKEDIYWLQVTGKDVEEKKLQLTLDRDSFNFAVPEELQKRSKGLQDEILDIFKNKAAKGELCQSKEIAARLGKTNAGGQASVRNAIAKLQAKGKIVSVKYGFYSLSHEKSATTLTPVALAVAVENSINPTVSELSATTATANPVFLDAISEGKKYKHTDEVTL